MNNDIDQNDDDNSTELGSSCQYFVFFVNPFWLTVNESKIQHCYNKSCWGDVGVAIAYSGHKDSCAIF